MSVDGGKESFHVDVEMYVEKVCADLDKSDNMATLSTQPVDDSVEGSWKLWMAQSCYPHPCTIYALFSISYTAVFNNNPDENRTSVYDQNRAFLRVSPPLARLS